MASTFQRSPRSAESPSPAKPQAMRKAREASEQHSGAPHAAPSASGPRRAAPARTASGAPPENASRATPRSSPSNSIRTAPATRPAKAATAPQGERLSKRVMQLKGCSRSEAEQYIESGWVRVDGVVVEDPPFRVQQQRVEVDPEASLLDVALVTVLLHKPPGALKEPLLPAAHWREDPLQRPLRKAQLRQLEELVPMELGASGLVVFTQDWRVRRKLEEDMAAMEHEILAEVAGVVSDEAMQRIARLFKDERHPLPAAKFSLNSNTPERSRLRFAIKGAHPGLLAHVCEKAGLELLALRRMRLGRVALGALPMGQWRYLADFERF